MCLKFQRIAPSIFEDKDDDHEDDAGDDGMRAGSDGIPVPDPSRTFFQVPDPSRPEN